MRNGEVIEIDKDLRVIKNVSDRPERLFVDGKIIASANNTAFRERIKMSSEGLLVIRIGSKNSKKSLSVQFSSFGLPRFEDYLEELKTNAEKYLNNETKRKDRYDIDQFEQVVREDIYSICGKKPILNIVGLE